MARDKVFKIWKPKEKNGNVRLKRCNDAAHSFKWEMVSITSLIFSQVLNFSKIYLITLSTFGLDPEVAINLVYAQSLNWMSAKFIGRWSMTQAEELKFELRHHDFDDSF